MLNLSNFFGVPDLSQVSALPGMNMGQLGTSMAGMNVSSDFAMPGGPNYAGMLSAMSGLASQGDSQNAPMMQPAPMQRLQAGGEQFAPLYQTQQAYQARPAAQALAGLLGGIYGNV
ncbi:MAG: hypothetical protein WBF88_17480 [Pusillimonas sp.]